MKLGARAARPKIMARCEDDILNGYNSSGLFVGEQKTCCIGVMFRWDPSEES